MHIPLQIRCLFLEWPKLSFSRRCLQNANETSYRQHDEHACDACDCHRGRFQDRMGRRQGGQYVPWVHRSLARVAISEIEGD
jgi:hypothetical protein